MSGELDLHTSRALHSVRQRTDSASAKWHIDLMIRQQPSTPRKSALVTLFEAARRRLTKERGDVAELPNTRIATATKELNQVTDDIRDAQGAPEVPAPIAPREPTLVFSTVGKILRWSKPDR